MNFKKIFPKQKPIIVAEIGNNHEGNFNKALKLIDAAVLSGADAVKFQTYKIENYYSERFTEKKRFRRLKKFQLSYDQFKKLSIYAKNKKIVFYSTPFDMESAHFLNKIQKLFKISSGDNNFISLIKLINKFKKPTILSTGLTNFKEIKQIANYFSGRKNKNNLGLLHCVSKYPASNEDLNLKSIPFLKKKFSHYEIGYSDHSLGIDSCKVALNLGAFMIEKHFTLDKNTSNFHDHKISANPDELKDLVNFANNLELMLGEMKKKPREDELKNIKGLRRSAYLKNNLAKDQKLFKTNIIWQRPHMPNQKNVSSHFGKRAKNDLKKGSLILKKDFK